MDTNLHLPFAATLDASDDTSGAIGLMALAEFVAGTQPAAVSTTLQRVRKEATLLPPGAAPARTANVSGRTTTLARGDGWTLVVSRFVGDGASVTVFAATEELARDVLAAATRDAVDPVRP